MTNLRITTIQTQLQWENPAANRIMLDTKLESLKGSTDLVILPEMFTTGFSMNATNWAESMTGKYYNRLIWMRPDQTYDTYDKRHLFTMANEHLTYTAGTKRLITEWLGWRVCPLVCYDLRFPVWVNRVGKDGNDFPYCGDTMIIEPAGAEILYHKTNVEEVHTATLSYEHLQKVRKKLPFLADRDDFMIK